jgi:hypothetical protein
MGQNRTINTIRIFFVLLCAVGSVVASMAVKEWNAWWWLALMIGLLGGALVVLVDISSADFPCAALGDDVWPRARRLGLMARQFVTAVRLGGTGGALHRTLGPLHRLHVPWRGDRATRQG